MSSIFDGIDPEQLQQLLSMNQGNNGMDLTMAGQTESQPSIWDQPNLPTIQGEEPEIPPTPPSSFTPGDVSGFANYGMTPPPLPDPMQQMGGLMGMMGNPNQNQQKPERRPVPGGLMAYLQSLGV